MMKRFMSPAILAFFVACQTARPVTGPVKPGTLAGTRSKHPPTFIESIKTQDAPDHPGLAGSRAVAATNLRPLPHPVGQNDYNDLRAKYSVLTNTPFEELSNVQLLVFMDQWYGAPYRYGGTTRSGIDCSAFAAQLLHDVYNLGGLPRMSADQYQATHHVLKRNLQEGDLVFFHTRPKSRRITHVGIYLYNHHFIHASLNGVQINDLDEGYYAEHYIGGGRLRGD